MIRLFPLFIEEVRCGHREPQAPVARCPHDASRARGGRVLRPKRVGPGRAKGLGRGRVAQLV
jgi:hypothetical protein